MKESRHKQVKARDLLQEQMLRQPQIKPGARIKYWRERLEPYHSIRALAAEMGVPHTTLASLENGKTTEGALVPLVARTLGLSYDYLLTGKGDHLASAADQISTAPKTETWDFEKVWRSRIDRLHPNDRRLLELELQQIIEGIESQRHLKRV